MNRNAKLVLLLVAVFLFGTAAGFVANEQVIRWRIARFARNEADMPVHLADKLAKRLGLTAGQRDAAEAAFRSAGEEMREERERARAAREGIRGRLDGRLLELMDEPQAAAFRGILAEQSARQAKHRAPPRP
ncbi:MAG: hypothetical protein IJS32_03065 [Kiritimatiellae bacterium]|nr:hypothetical protein [Kiritimatiellia bacterium]